MSSEDNQAYLAPHVEDVFSEAGDRPRKAPRNPKRQRQPPSSSAAAKKAGTDRSASDSGYSSNTHRTAESSNTGPAEAVKFDHDGSKEESRRAPYTNTHQLRKESFGTAKKPKPKPLSDARTKSSKTTSVPPPPHGTQWLRHPPTPATGYPPAPDLLRVNTSTPAVVPMTSPMGPPPPPPAYPQQMPPTAPCPQPPSSPAYHQAAPHPAYSAQYQQRPTSAQSHSYAYSAPPSALGNHTQNYLPPQQAQPSYQPSPQHYQNQHVPPQYQYQSSPYSAQPPTPSQSFAVPQRPNPVIRQHTTPVASQVYPQQYAHHQLQPRQQDPQTLAKLTSKERYADGVPFTDPADGQLKRYIGGIMYLWDKNARRKQHARQRHRRKAEEDEVPSDSSSCSTCESESDSPERRPSPRKSFAKLAKAKSDTSPRKDKRRESVASSRPSVTPELERDEKKKLSKVKEYQEQVATPPRRHTEVPRYIEDTARATKGSPRRASADDSSASSFPPSLSRSPRSKASGRDSSYSRGRDSKRDSFTISTKGPFSFRPIEDGYWFDAAEGQEMTMTINNGEDGRKEKRCPVEGSVQSEKRSDRRASMASSNRSSRVDKVPKMREAQR